MLPRSTNFLMYFFSPSVFGWRWLFFSYQRCSVATSRPELDAPGVVLLTLSEPCCFTLGVASSLMFWWECCVRVHVDILTAFSPEHWPGFCFALAYVTKDSPERVLMLKKSRIHNCRRNWQIASSKCGASHDVQDYQWCPSVSCEDVCQLLCSVGMFESMDLIDAVIKPIQSTRCVRDTWRIAGFLPLFVCFITATFSSKTYNGICMMNIRVWRYINNVSTRFTMFQYLTLMNKLEITSCLLVQNICDCVPQIHCWNAHHA